jgi:hypothetical protein
MYKIPTEEIFINTKRMCSNAQDVHNILPHIQTSFEEN